MHFAKDISSILLALDRPAERRTIYLTILRGPLRPFEAGVLTVLWWLDTDATGGKGGKLVTARLRTILYNFFTIFVY